MITSHNLFLVDVELLVWEAGERASKRGAVTKDQSCKNSYISS
jgi:hypothetical protein